MQNIYHRTRLLYFYSELLILITCLGFNDLAYSQNPFDIKSRKNIDSTFQKVELQTDARKSTSEVGVLDTESIQTNTEPSKDAGYVTIPEEITSDSGIGTTGTLQVHSDSINTSESPDSLDQLSNTDKQRSDRAVLDQDGIPGKIIFGDNAEQSISWWYYVFDLILLLILLAAFLNDKKIFSPLRKAFIHENFLRFLYRDTYLRKPGMFIYLNFIFLLCLGFILFRIGQYLGWSNTFREYIIIQALVFLVFILKHTVLYLLSQLVDKPFEVRFYQYWMILSAGFIGLWMIPLTLMVSVIPYRYFTLALIITIVTCAALLIYRHAKALYHANFFLSKHLFQYFLYFCAVEIIPALLLADILM